MRSFYRFVVAHSYDDVYRESESDTTGQPTALGQARAIIDHTEARDFKSSIRKWSLILSHCLPMVMVATHIRHVHHNVIIPNINPIDLLPIRLVRDS